MIKSREHEEARKKCEEDKGDLATFHSEQEENYFTDKKYSRHRFGYRKHGNKVAFVVQIISNQF